MVVGLLLAALLLLIGAITANRQRQTLQRLRSERFVPADDRTYLRGQIRRRLCTSAVLLLLGGLIGGYYLSGMDDRANEIGNRKQKAEEALAAGKDPPPNPAEADDRRFAKFLAWYWIAVLVLVFVVACLAVLDFWATRIYWMARYREIKADHETKLQRDLAVYRQQKLNDRMKGKVKGDNSADDTDEHPPAE